MEALVQSLSEFLNNYVSKEIVVFFISMLPVLELRAGLLAAKLLGVPLLQAIPLCVLGNIIPIPFILLFIKKIFALISYVNPGKKLVDKLESSAMKRSDNVKKFEFWGLVLFVGIPLPGTGAWTGSLIASLLNMKMRKSVPAILLGVLMATVIMSIVAYGLLGLFI